MQVVAYHVSSHAGVMYASHSVPPPKSLLWKNHSVCLDCIFFFLRERLRASCKFGSAPERGPGFIFADWSGFGVQPLPVLHCGQHLRGRFHRDPDFSQGPPVVFSTGARI